MDELRIDTFDLVGNSHGGCTAVVVNYLHRITAPTLLIYGERGAYHNYEAVGKAKIKRVRAVTIPNTGSFTHQENPRDTEKVLFSFLSEPVARMP
ncbi:MAG: alpha/beta hydrolase [Alphaproteobacteria bacterium]|nr:alpha/beta hydrolase [Alphaproteobacteria bacterium]